MAEGIKSQITVCISNIGYRNEGILREEWAKLPMTDADFQKWLSDNRLVDPMHEELDIADWQGIPFGLDDEKAFNDNVPLDELNALAKMMSETEPWRAETLKDAFSCGIDEPSTIAEAASLLAHAEDINCYPLPEFGYEADPETRLGYALIYNDDEAVKAIERLRVDGYIDYRKYAVDNMGSREIMLGDDCYVEGGLPDYDSWSREDLLNYSEQWDLRHAGPNTPEADAAAVRSQATYCKTDEFRTEIAKQEAALTEGLEPGTAEYAQAQDEARVAAADIVQERNGGGIGALYEFRAPSKGALKGEAPKEKAPEGAVPSIDFRRPPAPSITPRTPADDITHKR